MGIACRDSGSRRGIIRGEQRRPNEIGGDTMVLALPIVENKSILTETSGFLGDGFTHTINAYSGCSFAGSICGGYCYAQHNYWITRGRDWKLYGVKREVAE